MQICAGRAEVLKAELAPECGSAVLSGFFAVAAGRFIVVAGEIAFSDHLHFVTPLFDKEG